MEKTYNLSQAADKLSLTRQGLYYWIKRKWVSPRRDYKGYPVFTDDDLKKIKEWQAKINESKGQELTMPTVRILPIVYDSLVEPDRFLNMCARIVSTMNENELFKFYGVNVILAEDLIEYVPYLIKETIPPKETRYNSNNGWLTVDSKIRGRLGLLKTQDTVSSDSGLKYPNIPQEDIIIAIIPADVRTTQDIYNQESHFNTNASLWGSSEKTLIMVYHVGIIDSDGRVTNSIFKEQKLDQIGYSFIDVIAKEILGVDDILMEIVRIKFGYQKKNEDKNNDPFERLRVLFYGSDICSLMSLKKAILLFDDIHFCDRPSINFGGNWGTIGSASRIRKFVYTLACDGIPVIVHKQMPDAVYNSLRDSIAYELEDPQFSKMVFDGFKSEEMFRYLLVQPNANYAKGKGHEIIDAMMKLKLGDRQYALEDYTKSGPDWYNPRSKKSMEEVFAHALMEISAKLTMTCALCYENDLIPFTEYSTYDKLLSLRYQRALKQHNLEKSLAKIKLAQLSQKIFDSIIPDAVLDQANMEDVIKYRKETRGQYEAFRKYLMKLNYQIETKPFDSAFEGEIKKIIIEEVIPEADKFRNECTRIWEKMFGGFAKNVVVAPISSFVLSLFTGVSWLEILAKGCALVVVPPLIDFALEQRHIKRTNSLSYLMKFKGVK